MNVPSGWMVSQKDFASLSVLIGNSMGVGLVTRKILCYTYLLTLLARLLKDLIRDSRVSASYRGLFELPVCKYFIFKKQQRQWMVWDVTSEENRPSPRFVNWSLGLELKNKERKESVEIDFFFPGFCVTPPDNTMTQTTFANGPSLSLLSSFFFLCFSLLNRQLLHFLISIPQLSHCKRNPAHIDLVISHTLPHPFLIIKRPHCPWRWPRPL